MPPLPASLIFVRETAVEGRTVLFGQSTRHGKRQPARRSLLARLPAFARPSMQDTRDFLLAYCAGFLAVGAFIF